MVWSHHYSNNSVLSFILDLVFLKPTTLNSTSPHSSLIKSWNIEDNHLILNFPKVSLERENGCCRNPCNQSYKLPVPVLSLDSYLGPSQTMVDSNSHEESFEFTGNQRSFLQILPWKHQRNFQHEKRSHEQANEFITWHIFRNSASCSLVGW